MANLPETSTWETGVYQLEETDVVRGGPVADGGVSNMQAQQLGNRTKYLYDHLGRLDGIIVDTVSANMTIAAVDLLNKHHELSIALSGANVTINASALPDGAILSFSAVSNEDYKHVHLKPQSGMSFVGLPGVLSVTDLPIYAREAISFIKNGTDLIISSSKMQLDEVGEILYKAKAPMHALKAEGQLLDRTAYPRIWSYASSLPNLVTDTLWLQNGMKYIGCFSSGNGSSTFRMPDLRGLFLRGLDNGAGKDLDRLYTGEGGGQDAKAATHNHQITSLRVMVHAFKSSNFPYDNYAYVPAFSGTSGIVEGYNSFTYNNQGGINANNRPINAAFTAYIKY